LLVGCTPTLQPTASSNYDEDLSAHRPKYQIESQKKDTVKQDQQAALTNFAPQHDITDTLNAVLDSISILSQEIEYVDGYTVQVYSGNNREMANIARGKSYTVLQESEIKTRLFYDSPNFKVQVGKFFSPLEANATFAQLKRRFPNAILVEAKFKIERE